MTSALRIFTRRPGSETKKIAAITFWCLFVFHPRLFRLSHNFLKRLPDNELFLSIFDKTFLPFCSPFLTMGLVDDIKKNEVRSFTTSCQFLLQAPLSFRVIGRSCTQFAVILHRRSPPWNSARLRRTTLRTPKHSARPWLPTLASSRLPS